jgi:acyl-coenzyme A synthetase/AMP-(fatty) acid ligase
MYRDRDGYLFYRGRLDRMINTGYHVYPGEIEAAILAVSGIAAARVKGEDDEKWGTTLVADVVLASEAKADADGVLQRLADALGVRLAKYKIPRRYRIVEALSE